MKTREENPSHCSELTRREFLRSSAVAGVPLLGSLPGTSERPNVILIISDQFRWDCIGAYGLNPLNLTPQLDSMAAEGTIFTSAITNQPVCGPSRACLFTGSYANRHGVWRNGLPLDPQSTTLAKLFRSAGYTANYIGKWHLAPENHQDPATLGPVRKQYRGGFDDLWEGCNVLELTSHPYEGTIWDSDNKEIHFRDIYRVDFITERVLRFLGQGPRKPFLLVISYLEPHFQNDCNCFVAPKGYADRYRNPFVPRDLSFFPGDWQQQLPDYYGCIASVDENVGRLRQELAALRLADHTVVAFLSDHGCHFRTRNPEYKRSGHESSIHIPLVITGPGFNASRMVKNLVNQIDVAPTLLESASIPLPSSMQGRSFLGLAGGRSENWRDEVFIQISESMTGRALRTPQWTYVVAEPEGKSHPSATTYVEYQLYDCFADPHQLVNLAGRRETRDLSTHLRERLAILMKEAGEESSQILPAPLYP